MQIPLPRMVPESRTFWGALQENRLVAQRCKSCGKGIFYPRALCPTCHEIDLEWVELSQEGSVESFTVVHRAPSEAFAPLVPYTLALVRFDGVMVPGHLVGCLPEQVSIGMRVRLADPDLKRLPQGVEFQPSR